MTNISEKKIDMAAAEAITVVARAAEQAHSVIASATADALAVTSSRGDVVLERVDGIKALINEKFSENTKEHLEMKTHIMTTNGRVKALEIRNAVYAGALIIISLIVSGIIIPLTKDYLQNKNTSPEDLTSAINKVMSQYYDSK